MAKEGSIVRKGDYEYQTRGGKQYNFNVSKPAAPKKKSVVKVKKEVKIEPAAAKIPAKPVARPVSKTPSPMSQPVAKAPTEGMEFNPLTSTYTKKSDTKATNPFEGIFDSMEESRAKQFKKYGVTSGFKDGGRIRGDGMSRVKTKGRCL
jgi:hypothetical protein